MPGRPVASVSSGVGGGAELLEARQQGGHRVLVVDAVAGGRRAGADLDRDVLGSTHPHERVLVGDVVSEVDACDSAHVAAEGGDRGSLVRVGDRQLEHRLALEHLDAGVVEGDPPGVGDRGVAGVAGDASDVDDDGGRLVLDAGLGVVLLDEGLDVGAQLGERHLVVGRDGGGLHGLAHGGTRGLGPVAADEDDRLVLGDAGELTQRAEVSPGDDGDVHAGQARERPERLDGALDGGGLHRVGVERREHSVEVGRHEQDVRGGHGLERLGGRCAGAHDNLPSVALADPWVEPLVDPLDDSSPDPLDDSLGAGMSGAPSASGVGRGRDSALGNSGAAASAAR